MTNRFVQKAIVHFRVYNNPIIESFFSDGNLDSIQQSLRQQVRAKTGYTISAQSCEEIFIVMCHIYSNHAQQLQTNIRDHVVQLNNLVLHELVPMVTSNVKQYIQYINDISTLPTPIDRGSYTSIKGNNSLKLQDPF